MSERTVSTDGFIVPGDVIVGGVSFARRLASGETITGTPTAVVSQLDGATFSGIATSAVAVNTDVATIDGQSVAAGEGVMFTVTANSAAVPGAVYQVLVTAVTSDGQTFNERANITIL